MGGRANSDLNMFLAISKKIISRQNFNIIFCEMLLEFYKRLKLTPKIFPISLPARDSARYILERRVGLKCLKLCLGSLVVESSAILLHSVVGHFYI